MGKKNITSFGDEFAGNMANVFAPTEEVTTIVPPVAKTVETPKEPKPISNRKTQREYKSILLKIEKSKYDELVSVMENYESVTSVINKAIFEYIDKKKNI